MVFKVIDAVVIFIFKLIIKIIKTIFLITKTFFSNLKSIFMPMYEQRKIYKHATKRIDSEYEELL